MSVSQAAGSTLIQAAVTKQSGAAIMESERRCLLGANDRNAQMDTGSPVGL